jgi:hypothetical protein
MDDRHEDEDSRRQTRSLAGLAIILALALIAFFLIQKLKKEGEIEDCLLAGRTNCDVLVQ